MHTFYVDIHYCIATAMNMHKPHTQALSPQRLSLAGKPGKTESHAMTYLDVWRCGTFLLYSYKVAF